MVNDFLLEQKLKRDNPELHQIFCDCVFLTTRMLDSYKKWFPTYTDHSIFHSMNVVEFCNVLIGPENIEKMNDAEIFVLLLSCYLHDCGMGVSEKDFKLFMESIPHKEDFSLYGNADLMDAIRSYHHELSAQFIKKYGELLEIPSYEYIHAIGQVAKGHRKTDLFSETEYPAEYEVEEGKYVCLPYLAALIRLADEIDIAIDRNPYDMYIIKKNYTEKNIKEFRKHLAVKHLDIDTETATLLVETNDEEVLRDVYELSEKVQSTLDYCRDVVEKRTDYEISQTKILIRRLNMD